VLDVIYLCSPNNPTGAVFTRDELTAWVEYAKKHKSIILFDAAYCHFITDPETAKSIFEIPGARELAVEFRSFFQKCRVYRNSLCIYGSAQGVLSL
jgi:LL-diaminopimelate aminotransferase